MLVFENHVAVTQPLVLLKLDQSDTMQQMVLGSDADFGGKSSVSFMLDKTLGCGRFHGEIVSNTQGPMYAAFRTKNKKLFFKTSWDLSCYQYVLLYGMGDTRTYFINLQTPSFPMPDLYQASFAFKKPGKWEIVSVCLFFFLLNSVEPFKIPLNAFRLKIKGPGLSKQHLVKADQIQTIGISLLDQQPGPFELCIRWIQVNYFV